MGLEETWEDINSNFEPTPPENPVSPCDSALTPEEAQALHDQMAAQEDIPFDYPVDCCYARAQRMSDLMTAQGIPNQRAWAYGGLRPTQPDGSAVTFAGNQVTWGYHVAPTVRVKGADGTCRSMVIDPSLRDHPMTISEWEGIMGGVTSSATSGPNVFYRTPSGAQYTQGDRGVGNITTETAFDNHVASRDNALGVTE